GIRDDLVTGVQTCALPISILNNCISYFNSAPSGSNYLTSTLNYCCTTPQPGSGSGNITQDPMFVDRFPGNFRLQSNSPCINAGRSEERRVGKDHRTQSAQE